MFETLFSYPAVLRRHREGPLVAERTAYLERLAAQGMAQGTILSEARRVLYVANELQRWPSDHVFGEEEIEAVASEWARTRVESGRACTTRWPKEHFRFTMRELLGVTGRVRPPPAPPAGRYDQEVAAFVAAQQRGTWASEATCRCGEWQVKRFLRHLEQREVPLAAVTPAEVDAYFQDMAQRWGRASLRTSAKILRAWFAHCEARGLVARGVAASVISPRIYQQEGLAMGPTWEEIGRALEATAGSSPAELRDHAILRLLSVYGLRSGEVRRLSLDDIDWRHDRMGIIRSKTGLAVTLPLEPSVGNAIARYLRHGRPKNESRIVFLTLRAPHRPLSAGGLYGEGWRRLSKVSSCTKGRGPHALRHACARHLVGAGLSLKEVGDHLGHRSPDATRVYAKVDLPSLRQVAFDDLGGLA